MEPDDWREGPDPSGVGMRLVDATLDTVCARIASEGEISDASLSQLRLVFDKLFTSAVDLVDHARITRVTPMAGASGPKGRAFWKVESTSKQTYHCFHGYCSCQAYAFRASHATEHALICKHQLAVRLVEALGTERFNEQRLPDEIWGVELLRGCGEAVL
jgi:predicted nucleic acid-binding Zn finger protein